MRYPLTLKNFFLNRKSPHRAKFLGCRIIRNPNYRNFRIWYLQGSFEPTTASNMTHLCNRTNQGLPNLVKVENSCRRFLQQQSDMHTMHFPKIWCKSKNKIRCPTSGHLTFSTYLLTVKQVPRIHHQDL